MSRCRDDFWAWAAIVAAASSEDAPSSSCSCHRPYEWHEASSEELAARAARARVDAAARRRRHLAVLGYVLGLIALIAWVINAPSTSSHVSSQPAHFIPASVTADAEPHDAMPPPVNVADVKPAVESITLPAPLSAEASPLPSENVLNETAVLSVVTPEQNPAMVDAAFFETGSSRAEVLAAQGRPPTYSAHHDRTLWWGSSRVEFDAEGNVRSWVSGTPSLHVR